MKKYRWYVGLIVTLLGILLASPFISYAYILLVEFLIKVICVLFLGCQIIAWLFEVIIDYFVKQFEDKLNRIEAFITAHKDDIAERKRWELRYTRSAGSFVNRVLHLLEYRRNVLLHGYLLTGVCVVLLIAVFFIDTDGRNEAMAAMRERIEETIDKIIPEKESEEEVQEQNDENHNEYEEFKTAKDEKWEFILDDEERTFQLENEIEMFVFFDFRVGEVLEKEIEDFKKDLRKLKLTNTNYEGVTDGLNKTFSDYSDDESEFIKQIDSTKYMHLEEWLEKAPHSAQLDAYMIGRENINNSKDENTGQIGCYDLWWKLANDHQRYAQQYEYQTNNHSAVLFHYSMSVYCCMKALEFETSEAQYKETYHYMVTRYNDIKQKKSIIPQRYKKQAENIYNILKESDPN